MTRRCIAEYGEAIGRALLIGIRRHHTDGGRHDMRRWRADMSMGYRFCVVLLAEPHCLLRILTGFVPNSFLANGSRHGRRWPRPKAKT